MKTAIDEMKSMNMPIWLDLLAPDEVINIFSEKKTTHEKKEPSEDDEVYLAMLSEEKIEYQENDHKIIKVHTAKEFAKCYILYHDNVPVSVASIMDNNGAASLEFVGTVPEMRRKGFAKAICE